MQPIYLNVPYERKSEAKELGAKFDWDRLLWYANEGNIDELQRKFKIYEPLNNIVGENRGFGGSELYVDMIPSQSWFRNLRTCLVNKDDWNIVRKHVFERVNYTCECCGLWCKDSKIYDAEDYVKPTQYMHESTVRELQKWNNIQLEAHERWSFDDSKKVQKLERIIALCHRCHTVTHWGLAGIRGLHEEAEDHLMKVNKYTQDQCSKHITERTEFWRSLKEDYKLDLSIIRNSGFDIVEDDNI